MRISRKGPGNSLFSSTTPRSKLGVSMTSHWTNSSYIAWRRFFLHFNSKNFISASAPLDPGDLYVDQLLSSLVALELSLVIYHPTLSLSDDDDTVYFMNMIVPGDDKAWAIAVNMRTKELLGVAQFAAERTEDVPFTYAHCRISKYLTGSRES
ncbi:hypothetical protein BAE44_0015608 [Dichanthelium oligosanthes]|uniref:DUF1618 domain-containing protein n=1 Tax=Dichanthelium oligosanthes TaxID=888268 RepID=A0A1E5VDZ5_9POAL|nr:hypothetical protein BAE44_0015608 [Dichanthelium oligosanthes]